MEDPMAPLLNRIKALEEALEALRTKEGASLHYIASLAVGAGGAANFDFQNIPAVYSKLVLDLYARGDTAAAAVNVLCKFNNDGSAIYDYQVPYYNAGTWTNIVQVTQATGYIGDIPAASATANVFDTYCLELMEYANTSGWKGMQGQGDTKTSNLTAGLYLFQSRNWYRSTNAINRITLTPSAGNFAQYSTARLYGVI